jgi:hypothetical protein
VQSQPVKNKYWTGDGMKTAVFQTFYRKKEVKTSKTDEKQEENPTKILKNIFHRL